MIGYPSLTGVTRRRRHHEDEDAVVGHLEGEGVIADGKLIGIPAPDLPGVRADGHMVRLWHHDEVAVRHAGPAPHVAIIVDALESEADQSVTKDAEVFLVREASCPNEQGRRRGRFYERPNVMTPEPITQANRKNEPIASDAMRRDSGGTSGCILVAGAAYLAQLGLKAEFVDAL